MTIKIKWHLLLLSIAVFIASIGTRLVTEGMFMDGLIYASIARNLANGLGTIWDPHFTATILPSFHEHPPLAFILQSILFKVFGDYVFVEKSYTLLTAVLTGLLLIKIYHATWKSSTGLAYFLPLFFWVMVPQISWAYGNNMLENTMAVFSLASIYFIILGIMRKNLLFHVLAGLALACAFFTKGFSGLFPLVAPFLYWIIMDRSKWREMIINSTVLFLSLGITIGAVFLFWPGALQSLQLYFQLKIETNISQPITWKTLDIFRTFILENGIGILLSLVLFIVALLNRWKPAVDKTRTFWGIFFILLAFSGVIPISLSVKRAMYYTLCAIPVFSIGLAFLIAPLVDILSDKLSGRVKLGKWISIGILSLLFASLVYIGANSQTPHRDKKLISDIHAISHFIPNDEIISILPEMYPNWSLHGYMARYGNISLDANSFQHKFILVQKGLILPKNISLLQPPLFSGQSLILYPLKQDNK